MAVGKGSSKTIKHKGRDMANVSAEQLKASGHKSLRSYMNAWNKSGKRPGKGSTSSGTTKNAPSPKTIARGAGALPTSKSKAKAKPKSRAEQTAAAIRKEVAAKKAPAAKKASPRGRNKARTARVAPAPQRKKIASRRARRMAGRG